VPKTVRSRQPRLANLGPIEQLRAGRLPRRLTQLVIGLCLFGASLGLLIEATLGNAPWDVLHQGLTRHLPLSLGAVSIVVSLVVLLLWIPLRQRPGIGTFANAVIVGLMIDASMILLPTPESLPLRIGYLAAGIVLNAYGGALYIGAQLGPGARDGLMTGLMARTGRPVWQVRTAIELTVVLIGFLLGGTLWLGTLAFAVGVGPLIQLFLPRVIVALPVVRPGSQAVDDAADRSPGPVEPADQRCD
jgi:uncharacterized membrane protein YczE